MRVENETYHSVKKYLVVKSEKRKKAKGPWKRVKDELIKGVGCLCCQPWCWVE